MTPLKEAIEQTAELGKKLIAENPTMNMIGFQLLDYSVEEVKAIAKEYKTQAEFSEPHSRIAFLVHRSVGSAYIYIHVYSVEVKAKVVYE